ncbi:lytic transglycosylase domain-containing protein [Nanoarchaeota archaeon]
MEKTSSLEKGLMDMDEDEFNKIKAMIDDIESKKKIEIKNNKQKNNIKKVKKNGRIYNVGSSSSNVFNKIFNFIHLISIPALSASAISYISFESSKLINHYSINYQNNLEELIGKVGYFGVSNVFPYLFFGAGTYLGVSAAFKLFNSQKRSSSCPKFCLKPLGEVMISSILLINIFTSPTLQKKYDSQGIKSINQTNAIPEYLNGFQTIGLSDKDINRINAVNIYDDKINYYSDKHDIDKFLLKGLVAQESGGDPNAESGKGAKGLTQIIDSTAKENCGLVGKSIFDVDKNLDCGSKYLKIQFDKFNDVDLSLAAYNAGPNAVIKSGNKIPQYKETQNYVKNVKNFAKKFKKYETRKYN